MNWNMMTLIGTVASLAGVATGYWFWLRPRAQRRTETSRPISTSNSGTSNTGITVVGDGNVVHASPAILHSIDQHALSFRVAIEAEKSEKAGITLLQLAALLNEANQFQKKDILQFYEHKTFDISGSITSVTQSGSHLAITLDINADIFVSIYFESSEYSKFTHINDEGWHIELEAALQPSTINASYRLFFYKPTNIRLKPISGHLT